MKTIYCISGLGADEKAFSKLDIPGYSLRVISWKLPEPQETISAYATRMRAEINEEQPVLMGLSFGGIMSIEIAKQVPIEKIILISSVKTRKELPGWMKMTGRIGLHKVVPLRSTKLTEPFQNFTLGVTNEEERRMAIAYRRNVDMRYTKWAVDQVLTWKNDWDPGNIYHIHGDKDRMFPVKKANPHYTVSQGGHFMIMNKAAEISTQISAFLQG